MTDSTEIRQWYHQYLAADAGKLTDTSPLILAVQGDELDATLFEERISDIRSKLPATGRFCIDCQALFDDWPDLSDETATHPDGTECFPGSGADWKHTVAKSCHLIHLEAAARNGCLFCALLVRKLKDAEHLDTLRRINARIELLGESEKLHMSLQNWGKNQSQLFWVNWPGKVSGHCNAGNALSENLVIGALASDGRRGPDLWFKVHMVIFKR